MSLQFEWDAAKAHSNWVKHGIRFEEAVTVFADPRALTIYDGDHSTDEDRFHPIGYSERLRVLLVVHCDREERIRIITARRATSQEQRLYETDAE